jgi:hypothetical protein
MKPAHILKLSMLALALVFSAAFFVHDASALSCSDYSDSAIISTVYWNGQSDTNECKSAGYEGCYFHCCNDATCNSVSKYCSTSCGGDYAGFACCKKGTAPAPAPAPAPTPAPSTTYSATFSQSGIPSGTAWGVTVAGTRYTSTTSSATVSGLSGTASYSYASPLSGASGTRYSCSSGCSGTVTASSTSASATYNTQYQLTMSASPAAGGTVSPASGGWYDSGSSIVSIIATPALGYKFSSWTGSGTGSYSGSENPSSAVMNSPITETANFASCAPTTCAAQGKNCGPIPDGCGATLGCGTCTAPQTCGGGGTENVCGSGSSGTATFFQKGLPSPGGNSLAFCPTDQCPWTVTVDGKNYTATTGSSITTPVSGTVAYEYPSQKMPKGKLFTCISGCSGTIGAGGTASALFDTTLWIRSSPEGADVFVYITNPSSLNGKFVGTTPFELHSTAYQPSTWFKMKKAGYKDGNFPVFFHFFAQPYILGYMNPL